MLQLNPIDTNIRRQLHFREASIAKTVLQAATDSRTSEGNVLKADFYPLGTVWIRMTSPVKNGVVMLGGEMEDPAGDKSFSKMRHGFNEMYTQPITDGEGTIEPSYFRPLSGIKDISSTYDGGMKAIRNATVNWSCFSLEDLDRLTPYFLSHGTSVLLEWGWTSDEVGQTFSFEDILAGKCYTNIQDKIFENGGNYDAMCGVIKNYTWSLREDGGFDCVTDITSLGVNMIDNKVKSTIDSAYTTEERIEGDPPETKKYYMIEKVTMPKYIKDLSNQLKEFSKKKGTGVLFMEKEGDWLHFDVDIGPYVTWGWMEDNIISKFLSKVNTSTNLILSDMRSIIGGKSVIIANHEFLRTSDRKSFILPKQWPAENLRDTNLAQSWEQIQAERKKEEKVVAERKKAERAALKEEFGRAYIIVEKLGLIDLIDGIKSMIQTGKDAITAVIESAGDDFHEGVTREMAAVVNRDFEAFAVSENPNDGGYLRNILLHWETIQRAFGDVATVEAGLKNLFTEINRDSSIWDFSITTDQNNTGRMMVIDLNHINDSIDNLLDEKSRFEKGAVHGKLYEFKTWKEETLTKAQSMEAKLPSAMAMAAMYGRNTASETSGEEDPAGEGAGAAFKDKKDPILGPMKQGWKFKRFGLLNPKLVKGKIPSLTIDEGPELGALTPDETDEVLAEVEAGTGDQQNVADPDEIDPTDYATVIATLKAGGKTNFLPAKRHIYNQFGSMHKKYVEEMSYLINWKPGPSSRAEADQLVPIELSITLDGIGGIYPGNVFTSDYLPEVYRKTCVFQVKTLEHTVNADGWDVSITGQIRVALGKVADALVEIEAEKGVVQ